jgi:hypothetical protein
MMELSELLIDQCNGRRLRRVQQAKRSGKTLHAMMVRRIFLVGRCNGAAIRIMKAKLGERDIVESGGLRELAAGNRQQQRLHDQRIDRERANQPPPEGARFQSCLICSNAHVHNVLRYQALDFTGIDRFGFSRGAKSAFQYSLQGWRGKADRG